MLASKDVVYQFANTFLQKYIKTCLHSLFFVKKNHNIKNAGDGGQEHNITYCQK